MQKEMRVGKRKGPICVVQSARLGYLFNWSAVPKASLSRKGMLNLPFGPTG